MGQLPELNPALLAGIAATAGILLQLVVKPAFSPNSRWKAIAALILCCAVATGCMFLGATAPEGVNRIAYLVFHGIYAAGLSMGVWSGSKALAGN